MKITQNSERETWHCCSWYKIWRIIPISNNMRRRRKNVIWPINLICRCRMLLTKTVFKILKFLMKLYSSSTATTCNSKNIDIEMDPPASLSVSVTASSPISVCRSIKGLLVNRFWNGKHHCDVFHKPTPSLQ